MADSADIRSLEQLENFAAHTSKYRIAILREVENLSLELNRWTQWLQSDVTEYWRSQVRISALKHTEAQEALTRCLSCVRAEERRPCSEEKKHARRAAARKQLCEEKLKVTVSAARAWERDLNKIRTRIERLRDLADGDLQVAHRVLEDQIQTLKRYLSLVSNVGSDEGTAVDAQRPDDTTEANAAVAEKPQADSGR